MGEEAYSRHDHFIPDGRALITFAYGRLVECCEECLECLAEYPEEKSYVCV